MAGIKVEAGAAVRLDNVRIEGFDVGVEAKDATIVARGMSFHDVKQAWKIDGVSTADIGGTRVTERRKQIATSAPASRGWTPSSAPALPVLCGTCGAISPSRHHQFRGLYFNLWDNEEPCQKCGNSARLSEGVFDLAKDTVEVLKGPDITRAMLASLVAAGNAFAAGSTTSDEAIAEVGSISPSAASALRRFCRSGGVAAGALVVFFALANGYADFVKNYGVNPLAVSADYVLQQLLPALDIPSLEEAMKPGPKGDLNPKGTDPTYSEAVPEAMPGDFIPDDHLHI